MEPPTTATFKDNAPPKAQAIEAHNLYKNYENGTVQALQDVSLSIAEQEFVAIIGNSGSGKSTLLHVLSTLEQADSGKLKLQGQDLKDIARLDHFRANKLGFVFQLHFLLPHLSLLDNVCLPLEAGSVLPSKEKRQRGEEALIKVGLQDCLKRKPSAVSGGERQRAAIARAIVNNPAILFADEPTGNLDSKTEAKILELFQTIRSELGATLVMVTHNQALAEQAERILRMQDGKLQNESLPATH